MRHEARVKTLERKIIAANSVDFRLVVEYEDEVLDRCSDHQRRADDIPAGVTGILRIVRPRVDR